MNILLGKTLNELTALAVELGLPSYVGKQLAQWLYVKRVTSFEQMTNLSKAARALLNETCTIGRHTPVRSIQSSDGTIKYLFEIDSLTAAGGPTAEGGPTAQRSYIESVYIPEESRATLCVSTQAGCKMGCRFCMTGTLGFHGHLPASEILNQIFEIDSLSAQRSYSAAVLQHSGPTAAGGLTNLVYMGEGEPMDNLDAVLTSLEIMTADYGPAWSPKRITVSSVGLIPELERFLTETECHLAISLHNPFHEERLNIMPIEQRYHLTDVIAMLRNYDFTHQRRLSFEYICWAGVNDTPRHAKELVRLLGNLPCRVNLIRFHEGVNQPLPASNEQQMVWLRDYLTKHGVTTTIRRSRGEDILAACGMLVNSLKTN